MKLKAINEKELVVELDRKEQETYKRWLVELQQRFPKLKEIWQKAEMAWFTPELLRHEFSCKPFRGILSMPVGEMPGILVSRYTRCRGRPVDMRSMLAELKLLFLAPHEIVLKQEKEWRKKKYLSEIRDKIVRGAIKKAEYSAIRDADNCVARAERSILEWFSTKPEFLIPYLLMRNAVEQLLATGRIKPVQLTLVRAD